MRLKKDGYKVIGADWKRQEYFEEKEFCDEFHEVSWGVGGCGTWEGLKLKAIQTKHVCKLNPYYGCGSLEGLKPRPIQTKHIYKLIPYIHMREVGGPKT